MIPAVADPRVWKSVRTMYIGAGLLFLANIFLGFLNVLESPGIDRWQLLSHLHAGSVGWITFSVIATTVWMFTGNRTVSDGYAHHMQQLAWICLIAFGGYVISFALAFGTGRYVLLPIFGILSALLIWGAFFYALTNLRHQPVVSTVHWLLTGALLLASIGALMGVILGLENALSSIILNLTGGDRIGVHAGMMDAYLFLALGGMIEALLGGSSSPVTRAGRFQTGAWVLTGLIIWGALLTGLAEQLAPVAMLLLLVGAIIYVARIGHRTFRVTPFQGGRGPTVFWAGLWFPAYVVLFITAVLVFFIPGKDFPEWFSILFAHGLFVGAASNTILGLQYDAGRLGTGPMRHMLPTGTWLINLGIIAFVGGVYAAERVDGAVIMGIGALLAVMAMMLGLLQGGSPVRDLSAEAPNG